jgi:hypothetical protein
MKLDRSVAGRNQQDNNCLEEVAEQIAVM